MEEAGTELVSRISAKATDVTAHHLETPKTVHEVRADGKLEPGEVAEVVSCPVESVTVGTESVATGDDEGPALSVFLEVVVGVIGLHHGKESMSVGL